MEKKEIQVAAEAVGMWEARGCLRAFQGGVGREGKGFYFSSLPIAPAFPQLFTFSLAGLGCKTSL
jgi:hypothetical protein